MLTISARQPYSRLSSKRQLNASNPTPPRRTDSLAISGAVRSHWANPANLLQQLESFEGSGLWQSADRVLQTQDASGGWAERQGSAPDTDSSVLHHVALTALLRRQEHCKLYPDRYTKEQKAQLTPSPEQRDRLLKALDRSWNYLSPKTPLKGERSLEALPARTLGSVHQVAAQVHEAFLGDRLETRIDPEKSVQQALFLLDQAMAGGALEPQLKQPWSSRGPLLAGAAATALGAGMLLSGVGLAQVLAGLASGWMVASMAESVVHDKVAHCQDLPGSRPNQSNPSLV
ncbi:hypothetical protein JST97_37365, partial [bacterium]|nr:hypothetical protein [bacterium]